MSLQMSDAEHEETSFLAQLASLLIKKYGENMRSVCVVLPNQRAGLFLRREIVKQAGKATWSPVLLTFDRLVARITGLRALDDMDALLELFMVYRSLDIGKHDRFEDFMGWATIALRHFNEIDAYLVDRQHFYDDIRSFEEIEEWSLRNDPLSESQQFLVERWHLHGRLHATYNDHLIERGLAYNGLQERTCVEMLESGTVDLAWDEVWFAGLNALTSAEVHIIDALMKRKQAQVAWESDNHFLSDPVHGAGLSIRKHVAKWGEGLIPPSNALRSHNRQIRISSTPNSIAMVNYAVQYVNDLSEEERRYTTIVLTDTELIIPLLDALPKSIGPVNVTMSVPLAKIPLVSAFSGLISVVADNINQGSFNREHVLDFLTNPVVKHAFGTKNVEAVQRAIDDHGRIYFPVGVLNKAIDELPISNKETFKEILFCDKAILIPTGMLRLIDILKDATNDTLVNEQAYQLVKTVHALKKVFSLLPGSEQEIAVLKRMWRMLVQHSSMGLYGEPLQGLQIMGLLETRAIPLKHIVLLPANEGTLPPSAFERSFIPFDVRLAFNLPMRQDADAVITYHFYRALSTCTNMQILVNDKDGVEFSSQSRYIEQLDVELNHAEDENINTYLNYQIVQTKQDSAPIERFRIEVTDRVIAGIRAKLKKGLSPTALSSYFTCPLDFYYKYVLRLDQLDDPSVNVQRNTLGTIAHSVMEKCYDPSLGALTTERIDRFLMNLDNQFMDAIKAAQAEDIDEHTRNRYPLHMAKEAVKKSLHSEREFIKKGGSVSVVTVEESTNWSSQTAGLGIPFSIAGKIDRVELRNGIHRIVDLKTGSADAKKVKSELNLESLQKKTHALQMLVYSWAYLHIHPEVDDVQAVILPLRKHSDFEGYKLEIGNDTVISRRMLGDLDEFFHSVIEGMTEPGNYIVHNDDAEYCRFCIVQKTEKEAEASFPK